MKPALFYPILIGSFLLTLMSGCGRSAPAPVVNPPGGKTAITDYEVLGVDAATSTALVLCHLHTGRTHQLRVHFQHLSCADSVALVRAAKASGLPVTAEATPR